MSGDFPPVIQAEDRTIDEIMSAIQNQLLLGADPEEQRIAAGRLREAASYRGVDEDGTPVEKTIEALPAGSRLFGVLVV